MAERAFPGSRVSIILVYVVIGIALVLFVVWKNRPLGLVISFQETPSGVTFAVKVHPRAKKNAITGEVFDALKLSLTAPPVDGRANQACIEFFANLLKLPRSSVTISSGESSRRKVIRVAGLSVVEIRKRLG